MYAWRNGSEKTLCSIYSPFLHVIKDCLGTTVEFLGIWNGYLQAPRPGCLSLRFDRVGQVSQATLKLDDPCVGLLLNLGTDERDEIFEPVQHKLNLVGSRRSRQLSDQSHPVIPQIC